MLRIKPIVNSATNKWLCEVVKRCWSTIAVADTQENHESDANVHYDEAKSFKEIPGPDPWPVIGNTFRFLPYIGEFYNDSMYDQLLSFHKTYGTMMRLEKLLGRRPSVFLFDPDLSEKMYRLEGTWPTRIAILSLQYHRERTNWNNGHFGLASTNGEQWYKFRTKVNQPMMQPRTIKPHVGIIDEVASEMVSYVRSLRDPKTLELPDTFNNELNKWALESISAIALDTRLGCLDPNLNKQSEPQQMIDSVHEMFDLLYKLEINPSLWKYYDTKNLKKLFKALDTINRISVSRIESSQERMKQSLTDDTHNRSILQRLLDIDEQTAIAMAMDMLIAGIDTTSYAAGMLLYHTAANPRVQKKLHEEIDSVLVTKDSPVTYEALQKIPYLKACVKESLRLNPVAIGVLRTMNNNIVLGGYQIPKGTDVIAVHSVLSMDPKNYPQPREFIPERWIRGNTEAPLAKEAHPFAYMPFGFGPRTCIGRRFAELEVETLAMKMLRNFRLEWHRPPPRIQHHFISTVGSPLKFKLIDRT